jgi:PAS domain S-box-containing protein
MRGATVGERAAIPVGRSGAGAARPEAATQEPTRPGATTLPGAINRYTIFFVIIALSALSPAVGPSTSPDGRWWLAAVGVLAVMFFAGWAATRRPRTHWLHTLAPLLLFPAIHALRCADGNGRSGFAPLIFLPVVWFALYGRLRDVVLGIVGSALTLVLPMVVVGAPQYPTTNWRGTALLIVITTGLGLLTYRLVEGTTRANIALSRSETEFRAAFEDAPVGMAVTGLRGDERYRFVRVNRALCQLLGRPAEELTSHPVSAFTHADDREQSEQQFRTAVEADGPHRVEKRYVHKSGRTVWASISYSVIHDEHGEPSHLVSQIEDLGARRESDRALLEAFETDREATERLKRLERARSEMASMVSHELRTPLTAAAGYVELLAEGDAGPLTPEQRAMVDTIARNLGRLDGIVDDVLGLAGTERVDPLVVEPADLSAVLRSAVSAVTFQAATRGQGVVLRDELAGARVAGDPGRLERVVVNLLTNALKFSADDATVTVTGRHEADHAVLSVANAGIGIAPEDQERIFQTFYRADPENGSRTSGTGLGLAIVRSITAQYGGEITVDSELGKGSTFTLVLPLTD